MDERETELLAGVEAGGTKFICGIATADAPTELIARKRIDTAGPSETLGQVLEFLREFPGLRRVGVASFGPLDLVTASDTYGHITTTPKAGWAHTDLLGLIKQGLSDDRIRYGFDTDVNAAAIAEGRWGAARSAHTFVYLTVGTGIGGGAVANGSVVLGLSHPEMGHLSVPRHPDDAGFEGSCSSHGDCLEGLASGPAIEARWYTPAHELPELHPGWGIEAHYLGHGLANITFTLSPQVIVLGGGVMKTPGLAQRVTTELAQRLNGYVPTPTVSAPELGDDAGVLGAIALVLS